MYQEACHTVWLHLGLQNYILICLSIIGEIVGQLRSLSCSSSLPLSQSLGCLVLHSSKLVLLKNNKHKVRFAIFKPLDSCYWVSIIQYRDHLASRDIFHKNWPEGTESYGVRGHRIECCFPTAVTITNSYDPHSSLNTALNILQKSLPFSYGAKLMCFWVFAKWIIC